MSYYIVHRKLVCCVKSLHYIFSCIRQGSAHFEKLKEKLEKTVTIIKIPVYPPKKKLKKNLQHYINFSKLIRERM